MTNGAATHRMATTRADRGASRAGMGIPDLWHFATEYLLLLPAGALVGLIWANTGPETYFRAVFALGPVVTEIGMVFFFGLVMKEVVEATAPRGILHPWQRAALPMVAAVGVAVVPVLLLHAFAPAFGEPMVRAGWAATLAIDTAVGYFVALLVFGRHPVVPFFLLLAIAANGLGFVALAPAVAGSRPQYGLTALLMSLAIAVAYALRRFRVRAFLPYIVVGGGLSWSALVLGGIHPALALVPIVPFLPHAPRDPGFFVDAPAGATDALNAFERWCRHPAQIALCLFGLVTAGVPLRALDWGTLAMPTAMFVGKPIGLFIGVACGLALGLHLPHRVGWRELIVVAWLATAGFTMSLLFATVAIGPGPVLSEIKTGALVTVSGAAAAIAVARLLKVGRFARVSRER